MNPTGFHTIASSAPDDPRWTFTYVGESADWEEVSATSQSVDDPDIPSGAQLPLSMASPGDRMWIVELKGGHRMARRLTDLGLVCGSEITVISRTESGSVIVAREGCRIGLGAGMAHRVMVSAIAKATPVSAQPPHHPVPPVQGESSLPATLHLGALAVGQSGRIVGYEPGCRVYRRKLLSMGLTPGSHFTVTRQAPLGDPIEIEVRGFKLSLRKGEAAALRVETLSEEVRHD